MRDEPNVSHGGSGNRLFGHSAIKVNGKIFAMVSAAGAFVVKLPRQRVAALEVLGVGCQFEQGKGRLMKEWLVLDATATAQWLPLAREALAFVGAPP